MYDITRNLIDQVIMHPAIAPVSTFVVVLMLAIAALATLSGDSAGIEEDDE